MTVNARALVGAPTKETLAYGLFSVVETRQPTDAEGRTSRRWEAGVTWMNTCPDADTTYETCVLGNALGIPVTGMASPDPKAATAARSLWGATPFTVQVEVDCSPPGFWEQSDDVIAQVMGEAEQETVEAVFASGTVNGTANLAFPHLSGGGSLVDDSGATLQLVTANIGPTGAGVLDVVEALGRMDQALSSCVKGVGVIHVPAVLIAHLKANHLLELRDGTYYSPAGHKIAVGAGYTGANPGGVLTDGVSWMYGTGPVFMYRSRGRFIGDKKEQFDHSVDTLKRIYERTYLLGYDCCLFGVAVSTGGVITGTVNSAT